MAYLGRGPEYGLFTTQVIIGDGTTTSWPLNFAAPSASAVLVVVDGVVKEPLAAYTTPNGGLTIQFSEAIPNAVRCHVTYLGRTLTTAVAAGNETVKNAFSGNGAQTQFTMSGSPVVEAGVLVFVDGVMQSVGAGKNCTVAGNVVTFSAAPINGAEIDTYVLARERTAIDTVEDYTISRAKLANDIRGQVGTWVLASGNTNCAIGSHYFVDTFGAARTMTLPGSATFGDRIEFVDYSETFATNNCIIARNGHLINGVAADSTLNTNGTWKELVYSGATFGWRMK